MQILILFLVFAVGLLAGGLVTLLIESLFWGKQVRTMFAENHRVRTRLQEITSQLTASATQAHHISGELYGLTIRNEELKGLNQTQERDLATAVTAVELMREQVNQLSAELAELRAEHQVASRRLSVAAVVLKRLRQEKEPVPSDAPTSKRVEEESVHRSETILPEIQLETIPLTEPVNIDEEEPQAKFEDIRGIGPAYARRLREAGVKDVRDLAELDVERVGEIVGIKASSLAKVQDWIDQAQNLIA